VNSLLERRLLVVTGKGGVGKTTVACALGLLAARRGLRTLVVEVSDQRRLARLFGSDEGEESVEARLQERLWSVSIDPDRALLEWLQALGGRVSGRVLASSSTFQYFAAAAPGAKELVSMVKLLRLAEGDPRRGAKRRYDLVVLDAPATGHALGMLHSPLTFGAIARVGPIAAETERVRELLQDPARCGYLAVAQPTEMAVTEALELREDLRRRLGRELCAVIVNGVLPRRFDDLELRRIACPNGGGGAGASTATLAAATRVRPARGAQTDVRRAAALAAQAVHERARFQRNQIARLRRRRFRVIALPFSFVAELDLTAVTHISERLGKRL
jgi:anion-transporting  ArsA/GET3 family ATPase